MSYMWSIVDLKRCYVVHDCTQTALSFRCTESWVGPRDDQDKVQKRKICVAATNQTPFTCASIVKSTHYTDCMNDFSLLLSPYPLTSFSLWMAFSFSCIFLHSKSLLSAFFVSSLSLWCNSDICFLYNSSCGFQVPLFFSSWKKNMWVWKTAMVEIL